MEKILIFTATYNEVNNVETLISKISIYSQRSDILVIDDNSPDGTYYKLKNLQKNNVKLKLILRKKKLGLDTAHKKAYDYALKKKYDYLITMDADLSHDPKSIPKFLAKIKKKILLLDRGTLRVAKMS